MLTIAYVGFGVSVREYHIPYVEKRNDCKVKYVFRREEDIAQFTEYEPFYPEITFTTDFQSVLDDPEVNLVVVSAPDKFHVPYAKQILNAGKHALIEKPFAPTASEAREVFALAKSKGLICMPNQNRRFDADFLALKEVIASGKIGKLVRLESHYDYFKTNGWYDHLGTLYNLGVHTTDQIISLLGMPDKVRYDVRSIHHPSVGDDYYDIELFYGNSKASVNTSMCVLIDYPRFTLHGTNGSFTLPPVIHNSGKKKVVGRHVIDTSPAPEDRWGTLVY
ncbi:MAG: Gfo/Idh/MocA family oxidoreductase, partial [Synergistaceae bacterium]|nr:Gfo/Idh/MocA family oxidoreductase [Synergistaceae bacterium]